MSADNTAHPWLCQDRAAFEQRLRHHIAALGWATVSTYLETPTVHGRDVSLVYTVGLTERNLPELCITGLDHSLAGAFLYSLAGRAIDLAHTTGRCSTGNASARWPIAT